MKKNRSALTGLTIVSSIFLALLLCLPETGLSDGRSAWLHAGPLSVSKEKPAEPIEEKEVVQPIAKAAPVARPAEAKAPQPWGEQVQAWFQDMFDKTKRTIEIWWDEFKNRS